MDSVLNGSATLDASEPAPRLGSNILAAILLALSASAVYWLVAVFPKLP